MLEKYFTKMSTIDRYQGSWISSAIEDYVVWLAGHDYKDRCIWSRVPLVFAFGEFASAQGATVLEDLPSLVEDFVEFRAAENHRRTGSTRSMAKEVRGPVEQMLTVILAGFVPTGRKPLAEPFAEAVPGFFDYLAGERGLRPLTVRAYRFSLDRFADYLDRIGVDSIPELSPSILSSYIVDRAGSGLAKSTVRGDAGALRVFLRFAHREGVLANDLSESVGWPQVYRLSDIPRSISWTDVNKVLASVDRRNEIGRRDYAILLLLVTYGLRAREIAALTLDDVDWKHERLAIPERKAAHSTAFPLSSVVGEALLDYLRHGRPTTDDRHVFFRSVAPHRPIGAAAVSARSSHYLLKAGITVPRPGSHTLRHSAVQRLVDADFDLKTIGDFIGHRSARSTEIYAKVDVESLRTIAMGNGEEVL